MFEAKTNVLLLQPINDTEVALYRILFSSTSTQIFFKQFNKLKIPIYTSFNNIYFTSCFDFTKTSISLMIKSRTEFAESKTIYGSRAV
jgi:hypothetical protein